MHDDTKLITKLFINYYNKILKDTLADNFKTMVELILLFKKKSTMTKFSLLVV